jgi:hypothetical protein
MCDTARHLCVEVEAGGLLLDDATEAIRALLGGLALRANGIGERVCAVADALVRELAAEAGVAWHGVTVPGVEDRVNARIGVIEVRFPAMDFWALPAVVHEVGHLIARAPRLGVRQDATNGVRQVVDDGVLSSQREELFCDFYATYVMGPAFPAHLVFEGLDPTSADPAGLLLDPDRTTATHPTPDKRVRVMLHALALLDKVAGTFRASHVEVRGRLEREWADRERRAGTAGPSHPDTEATVVHLVGRFRAAAGADFGNRFATPMAARALADALRTGAIPDISAAIRVLDVVAAAWQARLASSPAEPGALVELGERALLAAEMVIGARIGATRRTS